MEIDADKVAHQVMAPGGQPYEQVVQAFGRDVLGTDGAIDRTKLAARVFRDPAALAKLEAIVHPAVYAEATRRVYDSDAPAVAIQAISAGSRAQRRPVRRGLGGGVQRGGATGPASRTPAA